MVMEPAYVSPESEKMMMEHMGQELKAVASDECVCYIHGLWNTCETALDEIGQFRALGGYPKTIKWFVFDWPAGLYPWASFFTVRRMSKDRGVKEDLRDFVKLLTRQGFRKFHFIGHSMGCRITCHLTEFIGELFQPLPESGIPVDTSLPICSTITLIHGEMDLVDFITIKFPILRQYCPVITSYTDAADQALDLAELLTGRLMMGKNPEAYFVDPLSRNVGVGSAFDITQEARIELQELVKLDGGIPGALPAGVLETARTMHRTASEAAASASGDGHVSIPMDDLVAASASAAPATSAAPGDEPQFRRNTKYASVSSLKEPHVKMWLDLDVIDNSFLDTNASAVRHSIFVLNRSLIDDISEIILKGHRAAQRSQRLIRRTGNLFYFLCAPSFVSI
ncbi:hypothetical protein DFJ74DRAFT_694412 [Hyaloraphidium curvatum]|nr:hypothetical protein DFJ74DRAFT_694412 [Hyaloraphidium curvatum]